MTDRYNAVVNQAIELDVMIRDNNILVDPFSVDKVEIYSNIVDARAEENILETILSITKVSTGKYSYTVGAIDTAGSYIDKIYYTPEEGGEQLVAYNYFYVREAYWSAVPSDIPDRCEVSGLVVDSAGNLIKGATVEITLESNEEVGGCSVLKSVDKVASNEVGFWKQLLIRSKTGGEEVVATFKITYVNKYGKSIIQTYSDKIIPDADSININELIASV